MPEVTSLSEKPAVSPPPVNPKPQPPPRRSWGEIKERAGSMGRLAVLFGFLLLVGAVGGWLYNARLNPRSATPSPTPNIANLSADELQKLGQLGANLGESGQTLNIAANALFRGSANVTGDLSVGGRLNANGPVTLSSLTLGGSPGTTALTVGSNLAVVGNTTVQQSLTVGQLIAGGSLNITGTASFNAMNANSLAVRTLSISGPLTISHLVTSGPTPGIVGGAVGGGGTVSISGNDTTGTVNVNTGSGPGNLLATITFRAAFGAGVHVQLTPLTDGAAAAGAYVTRTAAGFQIHARTPPAGTTLSFDYLVIQ
jgi:hypothetical protein